MSRSAHGLDHEDVVVEVRGPGEWIVGAPTGGRRLHVYQVTDDDWLVSEVGRRNEGRGADLPRAIAELGDDGVACDCGTLFRRRSRMRPGADADQPGLCAG